MKNNTRTRIANDVIAFLEKSGIRAQELSNASGVSCVIISRLKNGVQKDVNAETADALRASMHTFIAEGAPSCQTSAK